MDTCRQGGAAGFSIEVSKLGDRNLSSARKLFQGVGNEMDNGVCSTGHKTGQARNGPAVERADEGKQTEVESLPPRENRSSPVEKSLERRSSFGSGLFSTGSDTSYLNLQSPGEESQARALNMVDKLVWLNATGLPHELQQEEIKQPLLARGPVNAKGALQSRPQVAEVKTGMDDPFGVFDWVDSQHDEAGTLFGSAITKANIGKGVSKLSVAPGHCKHICFESKKCGSPPVVGPRTKKMDKLPEKVIKSVPTADKQRGFLSKNPLLAPENKLDQQEGRYERDLSNTGATENRWQAGSTGSALDLEDSNPNRVRNITEKQSCSSAKGLKNLEALNSTTVDQMRALCSSKVVHQQCSKNRAEQARLEILSQDNRLVREGREATKASNQLLKGAGVQKERVNRIEEELAGEPGTLHQHRQGAVPSEPDFDVKSFGGAKTSVVTKTASGTEYPTEQEIGAPHKLEGDLMPGDGAAELPYEVRRKNMIRHTESSLERLSTVPNPQDKVEFSTLPENDSGCELRDYNLRPGDVGNLPEFILGDSKISTVSRDSANTEHPHGFQYSGPQQKTYGNSPDKQVLSSKRVWKHPGSLEHTYDGAKQQVIDMNGSWGGAYMGGRLSSAVNAVPLTHCSEHGDALAILPRQNVGPDTEVAVETMELMKNNLINARSDELDVKEDRSETVETSSEIVPSPDDDERKPDVEVEIVSESDKGQMATRRSRSQGRYAQRLPTANPVDGASLTSQTKGRGRRVTWAGSLEQMPGQSSSTKRQDEDREEGDDGDDASESSGQDEEAGQGREITSRETRSRKRNSGVLDKMPDARDLDKTKRRFDMSEAAVARICRTKDDEEAKVISPTGVKIRSLSHIQPEAAEGVEVAVSAKVKSISKGLRSARIRCEEGSRKTRSRTSIEQGKLEAEEVVSPREQDVVDCEPPTAMETQPSDSKPLPCKRRMRSIADVSSPFRQMTSPGRPPLIRGLRRRRGSRFIKAPGEVRADMSEAELTDAPPLPSPISSPISGRLRGRGGPRSARKRKEPDMVHGLLTSELSVSPSSSKDTSPTDSKRMKQAGPTSVLLSHGLSEDTSKQQRKIVTKLGGKIVTSASECSHFVADRFVRTLNMLETMASGKPVVNIQWLESCSEAHRFVEEQEFILEDAKKEEEMGFSMVATLAAAQERPLLQGIRVYITPGTSPGPESLDRIVKAAGGQVVDKYCGPAPGEKQDSDFCIVISSEEEFEECTPLLEQGAKVYTPEFLLSGVTCHHLDFSRDQLFMNFRRRRRTPSSSRRSTF